MTIRFDLGHDPDHKFSRSYMEFAISQPKMVRLPWNEKQIYQLKLLNFRPHMWPPGWTLTMTFRPRPWIFKVKYGIFYISVKNGPVTKQKANISIELKARNVTVGFDFDHNLERWCLKIYRIVTGVTSDVGMPSTHLVYHFVKVKGFWLIYFLK